MRKAAEVHWESVPTPDWQRFLAGMVEWKARVMFEDWKMEVVKMGRKSRMTSTVR